jgi:hypothetical protein
MSSSFYIMLKQDSTELQIPNNTQPSQVNLYSNPLEAKEYKHTTNMFFYNQCFFQGHLKHCFFNHVLTPTPHPPTQTHTQHIHTHVRTQTHIHNTYTHLLTYTHNTYTHFHAHTPNIQHSIILLQWLLQIWKSLSLVIWIPLKNPNWTATKNSSHEISKWVVSSVALVYDKIKVT